MEKSINQKKGNDHSSETEIVSSHATKAFDPIRQESARAEKQKNLSQDSSRNKALQNKSIREWYILSQSTINLHDEDLLRPNTFSYNEKGDLYRIDFPNRKRANREDLGTEKFISLIRHINSKTDVDLPTNSSYGESSSSSKPDHVAIDIESSSKDSMTPLKREGPYEHRS